MGLSNEFRNGEAGAAIQLRVVISTLSTLTKPPNRPSKGPQKGPYRMAV